MKDIYYFIIGLYLLVYHLVLDAAEVLDANLDNISILEIYWRWLHAHGHTSWSTSQDDRSLLDGGSLGEEGDDLLDAEEQIISVRVLSHLSVHKGLQLQLVCGTNNGRRDKDGRDWCKLVESLAEAPLWNTTGVCRVALPCACGNIVGSSISGNVRERILLSDVLARLANDHGLKLLSDKIQVDSLG